MNQPTPPLPYPEKIIFAACSYYSLTEDQLKLPANTDKMKIVLYLLRNEAMMKFSRIGQRFGYKSHSYPREMYVEIDAQKDIYRQISVNINDIMKIVATL